MLHFYAVLHLLSYGICFMAIILAVIVFRRSRDSRVLYQAFALFGASFFLIAQLIDLYMSVGHLFADNQPFESFFVIGLYLSSAILFYVIPRFAFLMADRPFPRWLRLILGGASLFVLICTILWITLGKVFQESSLALLVIMFCDLLMVVNLGFLTVFLHLNRSRIPDPEVNWLATQYVRVFAVSLPFYGFEVFLCFTEFIKISYHFIFTPFMLLFWNIVNLRSLLRRLMPAHSLGQTIAPTVLIQFGLTKREQEVADLLFIKCSYQEISEKLGISLPTVKTHIRNIYQKMNVTSRNEMAECLKRAESQN